MDAWTDGFLGSAGAQPMSKGDGARFFAVVVWGLVGSACLPCFWNSFALLDNSVPGGYRFWRRQHLAWFFFFAFASDSHCGRYRVPLGNRDIRELP